MIDSRRAIRHVGVLLAMVCIAMLLAGRASAAPEGAESPTRDWAAIAAEATTQLGVAMEEAARGRPSESRLRNVIASFDDLLTRAPLSDRDRARVLFNRGVANLSLNDPAAAVFDLRRSDAFAPGRDATLRELENARAKLAESQRAEQATEPASATVTERSEVSAGLIAWNAIRRIDPSLRWTVGLAGASTAWGLLAVAVFSRRRDLRRPIVLTAAGLLAAAGGSIGTLWFEHRLNTSTTEVVVLSDECRAYQGPDDLAYPAATFAGRELVLRGTEFVVLEHRVLSENPEVIAWLHVRESGADVKSPPVWIPAEAVGWVRKPPTSPQPTDVRSPESPTPESAPAISPDVPTMRS